MIIEIAKEYARACHEGTNHRYGDKNESYMAHLELVFAYGGQFKHLLPEPDVENVLAACWTHDVIEDCRQSYNDVKNRTNIVVADITFALTNEKGKTRHDRANEAYYQGIKKTKHAAYVKFCDRMANIEYSHYNKNSMLDVYKQEHKNFIKQLGSHVPYEMEFAIKQILFPEIKFHPLY